MERTAFSFDDNDSGTGSDGVELVAPDFSAGDIGGEPDDRTFDPERHIARDKLNADGTFRRKRKRRGSSGNDSGGNSASRRNKKDQISASIDALSATLIIVHAGIANLTKTPELSLEPVESEVLAKSLANFLSEFDIAPSPKVQAAVGLIMTMGTVYGPKLYLINQRKKEEKSGASERPIMPEYNVPGMTAQ